MSFMPPSSKVAGENSRRRASRCGINCNKTIFIIFNVIFMVVGFVLLLVSLWCSVGQGRAVMMALAPSVGAGPDLLHLMYSLMGVGVVIILTAVMGTWASLKENEYSLGMYIAMILMVLGAEVGVGILGAMYHKEAMQDIERTLTHKIQQLYGVSGREEFTMAVDFVQVKLKCCGVFGYDEWSASAWRTEELGVRGAAVPLSCCFLRREKDAHINPVPVNRTMCQSPKEDIHREARHQEGCISRVSSWLREEYAAVLGVLVGIGLLEMAGLVTAASLCRMFCSLPD